jgi:hypothetical protein
MSESLIGKKYLPTDNSYSVNLTTSAPTFSSENKQLYLAGKYNEPAKLCEIVSEPFYCFINTGFDFPPDKKHKMILVEYEGNTCSVLFNDRCVVSDILENGLPLNWELDE